MDLRVNVQRFLSTADLQGRYYNQAIFHLAEFRSVNRTELCTVNGEDPFTVRPTSVPHRLLTVCSPYAHRLLTEELRLITKRNVRAKSASAYPKNSQKFHTRTRKVKLFVLFYHTDARLPLTSQSVYYYITIV